jgi:hypothetical protein
MEWMNTDMDFLKSCVFIDESGFHINMKKTNAWSAKGTTPIVTVPKIKATSHTIIGAISVYAVVKIDMKKSNKPQIGKKRKVANGKSTSTVRTGTTTDHYMKFLEAMMDELNKYHHMKNSY